MIYQKQKTMKSAFNKLTKAEKRIAIAKDVLMAIKSDVYNPETGNYVEPYFFSYFNRKDSVQTLLLQDRLKGCTVCALGACFLSLVKFTNRLTIDELTPIDANTMFINDNTKIHSNGKATSRLRKIFSKTQLTLIEVAFERSAYFADGVRINKELIENAVYFWQNFTRYEEDSVSEELLTGIMENIIANNGEFIPRINSI